MFPELTRHTRVLEIVGDTIRVKAEGAAFGDLAIVENVDGETSQAKVVELDRDIVSLQVFAGSKGLSTEAGVRFLGHPQNVTYSDNILGRIFKGSGEPFDEGPDLSADPKIEVAGPTVNPMMRVLPDKMIQTEVPMIDLFNCLVESQKIPIFSVAGEPYNELLARIGFQADADIVVFGDSFAFGHGADDRDFFAEVSSHPVIKAIGSNGYNLVQSLLWMERLASQLEGKLVVWFVFYGNDLYENLRPNLDRYRMPFLRQVAGTTSWEIVTSHVREEPWPFPTYRRYHERLAEICCPTYLSQRVFAAFRHLAERGREVCREVGADLAIIGIPDITQITADGVLRLEELAPTGQRLDVSLPDRRLRQICAQLGLPFVALRDHLGPEDHQHDDCHWNRRGHRKVAALIAQLHAQQALTTEPAGSDGRAQAALQEAAIR